MFLGRLKKLVKWLPEKNWGIESEEDTFHFISFFLNHFFAPLAICEFAYTYRCQPFAFWMVSGFRSLTRGTLLQSPPPMLGPRSSEFITGPALASRPSLSRPHAPAAA